MNDYNNSHFSFDFFISTLWPWNRYNAEVRSVRMKETSFRIYFQEIKIVYITLLLLNTVNGM